MKLLNGDFFVITDAGFDFHNRPITQFEEKVFQVRRSIEEMVIAEVIACGGYTGPDKIDSSIGRRHSFNLEKIKITRVNQEYVDELKKNTG